MQAEPWLDLSRDGTNRVISFGCDDCATTCARAAVAMLLAYLLFGDVPSGLEKGTACRDKDPLFSNHGHGGPR